MKRQSARHPRPGTAWESPGAKSSPAASGRASPSWIQHLHRTVGNRAVQRMLQRDGAYVQRGNDNEQDEDSKGSRSWATGKLNEALTQFAKNNPGMNTGHHKVPKSMMEDFYRALTPNQLATAKQQLDLTSNAGANSFKSLGSDITAGPNSGNRVEDPNRGFDGNRLESGQMTPRSELYEHMFELMTEFKQSEAKQMDDILFEKLLGLMVEAEKIHYQKTNGELLDPDLSMWTPATEDETEEKKRKLVDKGKMEEDAQLPPQFKKAEQTEAYKPDLEALKGKSVRELKDPKYRAKLPRNEPQQHSRLHSRYQWSRVDRYSMPLNQASLDRWSEDGFTRFYSKSQKSWCFAHETVYSEFADDADFVECHEPDTPDKEMELYGFHLLRPFG
ncbi:hypothetical protein ACFFNY_15125 [Paenibacillus hodogayensis]|uniref:Uncharacterized protein n=1 Tax=Paenibacillus hodogayensis TaxID=279208 RepID=A0ABV5VX48_9BACL